MATKVLMSCKCKYCGAPYSFYAKSKADAARMTGAQVCHSEECQEKQYQDALKRLEELRSEQ